MVNDINQAYMVGQIAQKVAVRVTENLMPPQFVCIELSPPDDYRTYDIKKAMDFPESLPRNFLDAAIKKLEGPLAIEFFSTVYGPYGTTWGYFFWEGALVNLAYFGWKRATTPAEASAGAIASPIRFIDAAIVQCGFCDEPRARNVRQTREYCEPL